MASRSKIYRLIDHSKRPTANLFVRANSKAEVAKILDNVPVIINKTY